MPQGHTNNPNGRPLGSRNRRTTETFERLEGRGDKDPADFLSEIVSNENEPKELRVQAANFLMPYKYGKRGTIPIARFIPEPIIVPIFQSIDEAEQFLNSIAVRLGAGEIDSQSALETNTIVKTWIDSKRAGEEHQLKITVQGGGKEQVIHIVGGMDPMPGTSILMPMSNGQMNGKTIDHVEPPVLNDSVAAEASGS